MLLPSGTRLGPYEITAPLGAGGMGEVYRARDARLGRDVAIKVLPGEVASDPERRARFEREARAVAALDHPHICGIYDVGEANGTHYLVMPLLEGQTLAARLERGPLPLADALTIASEIADALDRAHRQGIVHRDLKPANVMLTKSGVKLLDFGLAKLRPVAGAVALSDARSATTTAGTAEGTILGTIHYMAPEQVEGKEADHRADIWALGAVLYEMVTGERPFQGNTAASVMGAILKDAPAPVSTRQPLTPAALDVLVEECLAKTPDERWQSAGDLRRQLRRVASAGAAAQAAPIARSRPWAVVGLVVAAATVAAGGTWRLMTGSPAPSFASPAPVIRFQLTLPPNLALVPEQPPAVSPDGSRLALVAYDRDTNRRQIFLRAVSSVTAQAVGGTNDAQYPFWSPDGTKLAFFSHSRLRTVELTSGAVQDVAPVPNPGGPGVWIGPDILYPRSTGPVTRVAAAGGPTASVSTFDTAREVNQSIAGVLPDGRVLVSSQAGLFVADRAGATARVSEAITMPAALLTADAEGGEAVVIAYVSNGRLMAQRLRMSDLEAIGAPAELAAEASRLVTQSARPLSASANVLAFTSRSDVQTRPTWVGRDGTVLGPAASLTGQLRDIRLSPDGRRISLARFSEQGRFELVLVDLQRDTVSRLATELSFQQPSWAPDGLSLFGVGQQGTGARAIYRVAAREGAVAEEILLPPNATPANPQLSPDGALLSYAYTDAHGGFDIYLRPLAERGVGRPLVSGESYDAGGKVSPDGRWIAYHSNENGVLNVFVRSFPSGQDKLQVSVDGGQRPSWRRDGKELYFLAPDGGLVAAALAGEESLTVVRRERLFTAPVDSTFGTPGATLFDPAPDGQRFVMLVPTSTVPQPVTVIVNWQTLLLAR
nr:Serine/threonine-protein kinase PknD [uncultured bacterium]